MKNTRNFLQGIANLILVLAVLNLFQGCIVFRTIEKKHTTAHRIKKYNEDGKYFILYSKNGIYHLSNIKLSSIALAATVSELSPEHLQYLIPPGEKPSEVSEERKAVLSKEVVLVTQIEVPSNISDVYIQLTDIDKMYVYEEKLNAGSVVAIVLGCSLFAFSILILIALGQVNSMDI
jgi:hypothetical protein